MSLFVPNEGNIEKLKRYLYGNAGSENLTLKLCVTNLVSVPPTATDTAATYTEASFTGYAAKTLTSSQSGGTWAVPAGSPPSSAYGTAQTFTYTAGAGATQTIYAHYYVGANSGKLYGVEAYPAGKPMNPGDQHTVNVVLT